MDRDKKPPSEHLPLTKKEKKTNKQTNKTKTNKQTNKQTNKRTKMNEKQNNNNKQHECMTLLNVKMKSLPVHCFWYNYWKKGKK